MGFYVHSLCDLPLTNASNIIFQVLAPECARARNGPSGALLYGACVATIFIQPASLWRVYKWGDFPGLDLWCTPNGQLPLGQRLGT